MTNTTLSFRKDNYVKTTSGLIGKVASVKNLYVTIWDGQIEHIVDRGDVVAKVPAKEAKALLSNKPANTTKSKATKVTKSKATKVTKPTKVETTEGKGPSKKDLAIALYNEVKGEDKPRAAFMARIDEVGLSKAGASTYYQNIASGKWTT